MKTFFWTNTVWYLILGAIILAQLAIILYKSKNRANILALYCAIAGITFLFETSMMSLLTSYKYHPMIIPWSEYDDSVAGNFFSQFAVTGSALLLAVLGARKYWYIPVALAYGAIETLFLYLGIYEHYWYQTWITVIVLLVLFWFFGWIYRSSYSRPIKNFRKYVLIFLGLVTLHFHLLWGLRLLDIIKFKDNFLPESAVSGIESIIPGSKIFAQTTMLAGMYDNTISILCILIYFLKIDWKWKVIMLAVLFIPHFSLMQSGLIIYGTNWLIPGTLISILSMYFFVYILDKGFSRPRLSESTFKV
jgi:hypothetical protein